MKHYRCTKWCISRVRCLTLDPSTNQVVWRNPPLTLPTPSTTTTTTTTTTEASSTIIVAAPQTPSSVCNAASVQDAAQPSHHVITESSKSWINDDYAGINVVFKQMFAFSQLRVRCIHVRGRTIAWILNSPLLHGLDNTKSLFLRIYPIGFFSHNNRVESFEYITRKGREKVYKSTSEGRSISAW